MKKILIMGLPGAGKTYFAKELKKALSLTLAGDEDLDMLIARYEMLETNIGLITAKDISFLLQIELLF